MILDVVMPDEYIMRVCILLTRYSYFRSFREYGEAVLKHLENISDSDPKLQKAPVNYEGVRSLT